MAHTDDDTMNQLLGFLWKLVEREGGSITLPNDPSPIKGEFMMKSKDGFVTVLIKSKEQSTQ